MVGRDEVSCDEMIGEANSCEEEQNRAETSRRKTMWRNMTIYARVETGAYRSERMTGRLCRENMG
eukprot:scaffold35826_cov19-Prasinocladus_malaysianus.AAC.1